MPSFELWSNRVRLAYDLETLEEAEELIDFYIDQGYQNIIITSDRGLH